MVEGELDQLVTAAAAQLGLDEGAVRLDGAGRQEQALADLGVGVAERQQAEDLQLATGQTARAGYGVLRGDLIGPGPG